MAIVSDHIRINANKHCVWKALKKLHNLVNKPPSWSISNMGVGWENDGIYKLRIKGCLLPLKPKLVYYKLDQENGSTLATVFLEYRPNVGWSSSILNTIIRKRLKRLMRKSLRRLEQTSRPCLAANIARPH